MLLQKRETATIGVSCQVQNCFTPGGPLGGKFHFRGSFSSNFTYASPICGAWDIKEVNARGKTSQNLSTDTQSTGLYTPKLLHGLTFLNLES